MTADNGLYTRAPILESVIDLQVRFSEVPSIDRLRAFAVAQQALFPRSETINVFTVVGNVPEGKPVSVSQAHEEIGFKLIDASNRRILQAKKVGFSFSHLAPYTCWLDFRADAYSHWQLFRSFFAIEAITRTAVRYINRIEIPSSVIEPEHYFNLYPHTPNGTVIQNMSQFALQMVFPQSDIDAVAQVQQSGVPASAAKHLGILLDIDIYSTKEFSVENDDVWSHLDKLRERKNAVFEAAITDKTRELIK